ncbi:MAG: disulfide bond formation protein B [Candidatus Dasytiphilus stammeri]
MKKFGGYAEKQFNARKIGYLLNIVGMLVNNLILTIAFYYQLVKDELPCPICLLQRVGVIMISIGFFLNVRFGISSSHYGIALLGSIITGIIATRQVLLHILPGDPGYGSSIFGLHFYTLALLSSLVTIVAIAMLLILQRGEEIERHSINLTFEGKITIIIFMVLITANLVSTLLECGLGPCENNPTKYNFMP